VTTTTSTPNRRIAARKAPVYAEVVVKSGLFWTAVITPGDLPMPLRPDDTKTHRRLDSTEMGEHNLVK